MSEKEERILHIVQKLDGRFVGENRITRQEAIELIEKVLEESWWSVKTFRQISEAALNALLEGGK